MYFKFLKPLILLIILMSATNLMSQTESGCEWLIADFIQNPTKEIKLTGKPKIIDSPWGKAVQFNGKSDGIFLEKLPVKDLEKMTIEVLFRPEKKGKKEQRFFHTGLIESDRLLLETRVIKNEWCLDTYLRCGEEGLTLIDFNQMHEVNKWYHVAYVVNKGELTNYVNGVKELSGKMKMHPIKSGITSLGVRQNKISWFKGSIYKIKITPEVLTPELFMKY